MFLRHKRKLFLPLLTIAIFFAIGHKITSRSKIVSPIPSQKAKQPDRQLILFAKKKNPQELRGMIQSLVGATWKNYSVLVKDLTSTFEMGINETVMYEAASVNKIPILVALYSKAQEGSINLDKQITIQEKDIQDYGTGVIRYEKPGSAYSIKTLARLMMQKSDNTAGYILSVYFVSTAHVQKMLSGWGLTQTEMVEANQTSNRDVAILLTNLLDGKIVNQALTEELKSFLKDSDFEDRLPPLLPKTATVYHKTGDATAKLHDVGIIEDGKMRYYLGIFTSDITDEAETKQLMAKISKLVFDYLKP